MNLPFHLFRPRAVPSQNDRDPDRLATTADVAWNRPVFRAPALPTPQTFGYELPFPVNFRAKDRAARKSA